MNQLSVGSLVKHRKAYEEESDLGLIFDKGNTVIDLYTGCRGLRTGVSAYGIEVLGSSPVTDALVRAFRTHGLSWAYTHLGEKMLPVSFDDWEKWHKGPAPEVEPGDVVFVMKERDFEARVGYGILATVQVVVDRPNEYNYFMFGPYGLPVRGFVEDCYPVLEPKSKKRGV